MRTTKEFRQTVSFRLSKAQIELLDEYASYYKQGRGELIREAIQGFLHRQEELHPLPKVGVAKCDT